MPTTSYTETMMSRRYHQKVSEALGLTQLADTIDASLSVLRREASFAYYRQNPNCLAYSSDDTAVIPN